jgi:V8-like Glu-specific endopeptidase
MYPRNYFSRNAGLCVVALGVSALSFDAAAWDPLTHSAMKAIVDGKAVEVKQLVPKTATASFEVGPIKAGGSTKTVNVEGVGNAAIVRNASAYKEVAIPVINTSNDKVTAKTPSTLKWEEKLEKNIGDQKSLVQDVSDEVKNIEAAVEAYLKEPNASTGQRRDQSYDNVLTALINTYSKTNDPEMRAHLASLYGRFLSEQKAWYGVHDNNYRPVVYQGIYNSAASCVGIVDHGESRPFASGVLIGENLILTCRHMVSERIPVDLRVWFDYQDGNPNTAEQCKVISRIDVSDTPDDPKLSPLDFCLLTIERKPNSKVRHPLPISTANVRRGMPIYLIGHPSQAPQTVHDNAWVLFPYMVSPSTMKELRIAVNAELVGKGSTSAIATDHFIESYKPDTVGGQQIFRYIGNWEGQSLPMIGAECETFKGDSGSPAILRERGAIIGILIQGQPDQADYGTNPTRDVHGYSAGWVYHEKILPMGPIVDYLDRHPETADWRVKYKPIFDEGT